LQLEYITNNIHIFITIRFNTIMGLSSLSTTSMEDVARAAPTGLKWFQLYVYKDRQLTLNLVQRAERAGYKALVVTVDAPKLGRREADIRNRFQLPNHLQLANFIDPNTNENINSASTTNYQSNGSGVASYFSMLIDDSLTWDDIHWLRENTILKIIVKGILTVKGVEEAIQHKVDGIWISNHGARQLDTVPSSIDVLADIHNSHIGNRLRIPLFLDGGIMRGTDIMKALALGAKAVFIGRPMLWGLACNGQEGVERVLEILKEELELSMKLMGVRNVEELNSSMIRRSPYMFIQSKL
jgi:(S)-2-hydroxy-acid oxidase